MTIPQILQSIRTYLDNRPSQSASGTEVGVWHRQNYPSVFRSGRLKNIIQNNGEQFGVYWENPDTVYSLSAESTCMEIIEKVVKENNNQCLGSQIAAVLRQKVPGVYSTITQGLKKFIEAHGDAYNIYWKGMHHVIYQAPLSQEQECVKLLQDFVNKRGGFLSPGQFPLFLRAYPEYLNVFAHWGWKSFVLRFGESDLYWTNRGIVTEQPAHDQQQTVEEKKFVPSVSSATAPPSRWRLRRKWIPHRSPAYGNRPSIIRAQFVYPVDRFFIPYHLESALQASNENDAIAGQIFQEKLRNYLENEPAYRAEQKEKQWQNKSLKELNREEAILLMEQNSSRYLALHDALEYIEEMQMKFDLLQYDLPSTAIMPTDKNLFIIEVPGLAEKRPSVLRGDRIEVRISSADPQGSEHCGYVFFVHLADIRVSFHSSFPRNGARAAVHFTINRTPLRLMHRALNSRTSESILNAVAAKTSTPHLATVNDENEDEDEKVMTRRALHSRIWIATKLNDWQHAAMDAILDSHRPAFHPFILFGPPGTGKTSTLVETILQVVGHSSIARILVCAPSNDAVDLIATRLLQHMSDKQKMLRLNGMNRMKLTVPQEVFAVSSWDEQDRAFTIPPLERLLSYQIILSTNVCSGYLYSMGIPAGHFSYVIIDEAAQATLSETMIPLMMASKTTNIVIAGDHKQLGAMVRSQVALQYGLDISLMERIIAMKLSAATRPANGSGSSGNSSSNSSSSSSSLSLALVPHATTQNVAGVELAHVHHLIKLRDNYRAHPAILSLYNEMTYQGELIARASPSSVNCLVNWSHLPRLGTPILFQDCRGRECREADSPSWFNMDEAFKVCAYAMDLVSVHKINPKDIGIITPYRKQCDKIRRKLHYEENEGKRIPGLSNIKVGVTEIFQGDERTVILISTVRSEREFLATDVKFRIGFVANAKRLNVAISRAKALLVLVGNSELLAENDSGWLQLLEKIDAMGGYRGQKLNWQKIKDEQKKKKKNADSEQNLEDSEEKNADGVAVVAEEIAGIDWRLPDV